MTLRRAQGLPLGGALELLRLVWAVDHGLQATSKRMEQRLGITGPQRFTLRLIGRFPGVTAGQLADALNVHPSTMTGVLKRLMKRRLIVRRPDPRDRRRSFLALTEAGRALDVDPSGTVEGAVTKVLETLPKAHVDTARAVLQSLADALEERDEALRAAAG